MEDLDPTTSRRLGNGRVHLHAIPEEQETHTGVCRYHDTLQKTVDRIDKRSSRQHVLLKLLVVLVPLVGVCITAWATVTAARSSTLEQRIVRVLERMEASH